MAKPNNKQKMAALWRPTGAPETWGAPSTTGGGVIQPAIDATAANGGGVNDRLPVGRATGPGASLVTPPPAGFSINTSPGKPPRSARGSQYS